MSKSKKRHLLLPVLFLLLLVLAGCRQPGQEENGDVLWVVTEASCSDGMNLQAEMIARRMEQTHENLTVHLDILPTDPREREIALKQLRTRIMAGDGPDVYLLPTGNVLTEDHPTSRAWIRSTTQTRVVPLFPDVTQAMRGNLFADIQGYYDADQALETQALREEIMAAGTMGEKRYVLPLRFDIPAVLTDPEAWRDFGLDRELLESDVITLTSALLAQPNGAEASAGIRLPSDLSLLSRLFDYDKEEVLVTAREIGDYMRLYQSWKAVSVDAVESLVQEAEHRYYTMLLEQILPMDSNMTIQSLKEEFPFKPVITISSFNDLNEYVHMHLHWWEAGLPLYTCPLADVLQTAIIAKGEHVALPMFPLRAADGSVVANITYYGAVGSSCKDPALAYAFLRQFLTEEFQWDIYRPRIEKNIYSSNPSKRLEQEPQCGGQVENSWPVRTDGSVPWLWRTVQYQMRGVYHSFYGAYETRQFILMELTDDDVPILSLPIDEVRFPVTLDSAGSLEHALSLLNEEDGSPTDADIDALSQEVRMNLWWHLAEG